MIIEFSGSPKSGKDAVIARLRDRAFPGPVDFVEEVVQRCPVTNQHFDQRLLWTVHVTLAEARRIESRHSELNGGLAVFNRGLFDALAFLRLLPEEQPALAGTAARLRDLLLADPVLERTGAIFLFLTSYDKAIERKLDRTRPGSTHRIVNAPFIVRLNAAYEALVAELGGRLPLVLIDDRERPLSVDEKLAAVEAHLHAQLGLPG